MEEENAILALLEDSEEESEEEEACEGVQCEGGAREEEAHEEEEASEEEARHEEDEEEVSKEEDTLPKGCLEKQIAYRGCKVSLAVQQENAAEIAGILNCLAVSVGAEYELHPGCRCHLPDGSGEMFFVQALLVEYCRTDRPDLADLAGEGLFLVFHCPARKSARRGRVLLELQPEFLPELFPGCDNPRSRDRMKWEKGVTCCQVALLDTSTVLTAVSECLSPDLSDRYFGVRQVLQQQLSATAAEEDEWEFQVQWRSAHQENTTWEPLSSKFSLYSNVHFSPNSKKF